MVRARLPGERLFLLGYTLAGSLLSALLVLLHGPDALLIFLIGPIVFAALFYPRRLHLSMCLINTLLAVTVTYHISLNFHESLKSIAALAVTVLGVSEVIHWLIRGRTRAEQALRESVERHRAISDLTSDYVYAVDITPNGHRRTAWATEAFNRITGYTIEELEARGGWLTIIHPDDQGISDRRAQTVLSGQTDVSELRIIAKSGEVRWLRAYTRPQWDPQQERVARVLGAMQDITARKQVTEKLRQQNEYLAALHATTLALMNRLEPADLLQAIVVRAAQLLGTAHGYVYLVEQEGQQIEIKVGTGFYVDYVGFRLKLGEGLAGTIWQTGQPLVVDDYRIWESRLPTISHDGIRALVGVPLTSGSQVVGVIGMCYAEPGRTFDESQVELLSRFAQLASIALDNARLYALAQQELADRRRAEEQRLAIERKMQEAQKLESLGVLAGGIAHDFNNLLQVILGNTALVQGELPPGSHNRAGLDAVETAARRAADLTQQMLAYAGKGRFVVQRLDLNAVVAEMTTLIQSSIGKNVTLRYQLGADLPQIEADATQIRQVVMNLIINASEAIGGAEGTITLSTSVVDVDRAYLDTTYLAPDLPAGPYVCFEVADTGCGMDAETLAKIFEPFFTTKFTGRGLGLAAVLGIARGHAGALKVQSRRRRGTTFTIVFPGLAWEQLRGALKQQPAAEPREQASATPAVGSATGSGGTILVIDDEEGVRKIAARMLQHIGFKALTAPDGRTGVEVFRAEAGAVAVVLLDLTMPRMSGEQTFRALQQIKPDTPIVLMSGYTEAEATRRFDGMSPAGFIQKPFTLKDLRERVQQALDLTTSR